MKIPLGLEPGVLSSSSNGLMERAHSRMGERQPAVKIRCLLLLVLAWAQLEIAHGQTLFPPHEATVISDTIASLSIAKNENSSASSSSNKAIPALNVSSPEYIVIEFVGGFVRHDDRKHPEVQFAAYLREHYKSVVHAEVFSNHDGREALREVLYLIRSDSAMSGENQRPKIILCGHSWGASEVAAFAKELGRRGIPVLLTIQLDIIAKPGARGSVIPSNVAKAVNFYQSAGWLHGQSQIVAADPGRTEIIGSFQMTYSEHPVDCSNFPWYARTFNRSHLEIENDPRVWHRIASMIDSEISSSGPTASASQHSELVSN